VRPRRAEHHLAACEVNLNADRLEINANDGDPTTWDYFGLDDMTFFPGLG
jgi:hypothetical protein